MRARLKRPSTNPGERIASAFYARFSDYGASLTRPLGGLGLFTGLFALIYLALGAASGDAAVTLNPRPVFQTTPPYLTTAPRAAELGQAMDFSAVNAVRPFWGLSAQEREAANDAFTPGGPESAAGAVGETAGDNLFVYDLMAVPSLWSGLMTVVITIQSLFSLVFAFLFALAVRRRFQISL